MGICNNPPAPCGTPDPPLPTCLFVQNGPLRIEIRRGEEGIRCSMIRSFFLITSAPNIEHRTKAGPHRNLN